MQDGHLEIVPVGGLQGETTWVRRQAEKTEPLADDDAAGNRSALNATAMNSSTPERMVRSDLRFPSPF
jgi:hypothetical protein